MYKWSPTDWGRGWNQGMNRGRNEKKTMENRGGIKERSRRGIRGEDESGEESGEKWSEDPDRNQGESGEESRDEPREKSGRNRYLFNGPPSTVFNAVRSKTASLDFVVVDTRQTDCQRRRERSYWGNLSA